MIEMEALQKDMNINLDEVNWEIRSSSSIAKRIAEDRFVELKTKYASRLKDAVYYVCLKGKYSSEYVEQITADSPAPPITVNSRDFYRELSAGIWQIMGSRKEFGISEMAFLINNVYDMLYKYNCILADFQGENIADIDSCIQFHGGLKNEEELVDHVKLIVTNSVGDNFVKFWIGETILAKALENKHTSPILVATVIENGKENFEFQGCANVRVETNDLPSKALVGKILQDVKGKVKTIKLAQKTDVKQ